MGPKWSQGANLEKFRRSPSFPAYNGTCALNFPVPITNLLFPTTGPTTCSFSGLHPKSKFFAFITVLRFVPRMAPIKVGIFPLLKKNEEQVRLCREIQKTLQPWMNVFYYDSGALGRRYRRQDEIGTPFCVTVDFDTLGEENPELKDTVTIRHHDSKEREHLPISGLLAWFLERVR
jgi:hypothetical protein